MAASGSSSTAAGWTKGKILGLIVSVLFAAGLVAVIVVGVKNPEAYKHKDKATSSTPAATTKTSTLSDGATGAQPVAQTPVAPTKPAVTTPATTPAKPAAPATNPIIAQQTAVTAKVQELLGSTTSKLPKDSKLGEFLGNVGKVIGDTNKIQDAAKQALGGPGGAAGPGCTPANGKELVKAINVDKCTYVSLTRNSTYNLPKGSILEITQPVVIVGNPANRPVVDASKTTRAFHVTSDGYLQISFIEIWRGNEYTQGDFIYTRGGSVLADPGAGLSAIGCVFSQPTRNIYANDLRYQLVLGGHLLIMGGEIFITGCQFWNVNPLAVRLPAFIGGDELIVAGVVWETATTHTQISGVVLGLGTGVFVSLMGGLGVYTACTFTRALVAAAAFGYGIQIGIGGGVGVFSGCTITTNVPLFAFAGAGGQQFMGGGVLVNTGVESIGAFGVASPVGLAPFVTFGGGIWISTGATYNVNAGAQYISVTGGLSFQGGGVSNIVGTNFVRSIGLAAAYGLAGQHFLGGGSVQMIGGGNSLQTGVSGAWFLGGQQYTGGGVHIEVAQPSSRNHPVVFRAGQGNHAFVGGGAAVFVATQDDGQSPPQTTWNPPYQKRFWVMNRGAKQADIWGAVITAPPPVIQPGWPFAGPFNGYSRHLQEAENATIDWELTASPGDATAQTFFDKQDALAEFGGVPTSLCMHQVSMTGTETFENGCEGGLEVSGEALESCTYSDVTLDPNVCGPDASPVGPNAAASCQNVEGYCASYVSTGLRHQRKLRELEEGNHATYVTRTDFLAACLSEDNCLQPEDLKAAVKDFLVNKGGIDSKINGLAFSAVKSDLDPVVADFAPPSALNTDSGIPAFPFARSISVFTVTDDKGEYDVIKELLPTLNDDPNNADFTDALKSKADGLGVVASDMPLSLKIPSVVVGAVDKLANANPGMDGAFSRVLVKDSTGKYTTDLQAGQQYTAEAKLFFPGSSLDFLLDNAEDMNDQPVAIATNKLASPLGTAEATFTAPATWEGLHLYVTVKCTTKGLEGFPAHSDVLTFVD